MSAFIFADVERAITTGAVATTMMATVARVVWRHATKSVERRWHEALAPLTTAVDKLCSEQRAIVDRVEVLEAKGGHHDTEWL